MNLPVVTITRLDKGARWSASVHGSSMVHLGRTAQGALEQALPHVAVSEKEAESCSKK